MPEKITKLTSEQVARFGEWVENWVKIGLSTEPADFDRAEAAVRQMYTFAGLKQPKVVLRLSSPLALCCGGVLGLALLALGKKQLTVESQVGSQAYSNLYHGAFWASWGAYVSFLRDVCSWSNSILDRFAAEETLIRNCGYVWWHEDVCAISDRPCLIVRDNQNRLHSEVGPALAYRDGWNIYSWHGTTIPADWIEDKNSLTPKVALSQRNAEQRRVACEILGWAAVLSQLSVRSLDKDRDPQVGELVEVELPDVGPSRFLRVRCGTGRQFVIGVPNHLEKALDAQAWMVGLEPKDFAIPEIRT